MLSVETIIKHMRAIEVDLDSPLEVLDYLEKLLPELSYNDPLIKNKRAGNIANADELLQYTRTCERVWRKLYPRKHVIDHASNIKKHLNYRELFR